MLSELGPLVGPDLGNQVAWALVKVDGSFDAVNYQGAQGIVVHAVILSALSDIEARPTRGYGQVRLTPISEQAAGRAAPVRTGEGQVAG